ncbi:MAG: 2'-5' RNA ligase family protein [Brevibacterium sp.]|nr:2'-5' RNA ligase family protein [Brevibacterium sp.]MDN5832994.1 2'-5' RNA ligase family protein [Brevibacterium sp.]MDN5876988.1 2'-5' RNA ligase family protein [Brevibacterium sp.]MDN5910783.1 2'-5' RNA ligase family protein [Brevibacterium sp.]MDN6123269.1 2'-5' RNA ligase family protein [Brevibacterium sp.]
MGPFVDLGDVDASLIGAVRRILKPHKTFDFRLTSVGNFGDLKYLAPDPTEPFIQLTQTFVAAFPQWPPYEGAFNKIIPHLSIGDSLSAPEVSAVEECLPITATATEVTLTWWSDDAAETEVIERFPLSTYPK